MTALQLGQFIPQHLEMALEKSVVGVSPWLLFFGAMYSHLVALDIMISSNKLFYCSGSWYRCFISGQPLLQIIGSAVLSSTMWYWYLKYAHDEEDEEMDEDERALADNIFYGRISGRAFFYLFVAIAVITSVGAARIVVLHGADSEKARAFAQTCGLTSAALNAVMWLPQIYVTWMYRHKGALAIGWVFSSIAMDVIYSVYLAALGFNFSVWANNIPDGIQTSLLLGMVLYFEYEDRKAGQDNFGHPLEYYEGEQPLILRKHSSLEQALNPLPYGAAEV